jgi:hypothetical protein
VSRLDFICAHGFDRADRRPPLSSCTGTESRLVSPDAAERWRTPHGVAGDCSNRRTKRDPPLT